MEGEKRIRTLKQLAKVAQEKRAVYCPSTNAFRKRTPATFILHLQGADILLLLRAGMFLYRKPKKPARGKIKSRLYRCPWCGSREIKEIDEEFVECLGCKKRTDKFEAMK